jgi:ethanolamine utilization microcompartment shell protein EutL
MLQLSYAAGMPIPVLCSLRCEDEQALDLLAQSTSVGLLVARTLAVGTTAMDVAAQQTHTTFKEVMAKAHWWPSDHGVLDVKPGSGVRHVQGEVQLRKIMKPSSVFPRLSVYVRALLWF